MASTYVNNLRLEEITTGEKSGTWGSITNTNLELIGEALGYGTENMGSDANTTITVADGSSDSARSFYLKITSTSLSADRTVTLAPNTVSKVWIIENATTGGKAITIKQGTGATIDIPNGDVKMVATDGAGAGGAVYDLLVDLNIATKLTVKNPATSSSPATLLLQSGDTDVAADDVLGKIQFQAPDEGTGTDALLVAGEIAAISEGDFSSSSNATKLSFKTGASEAATEKMSISSVGNVTMKQTATGDDTPMTLLLQTGETDIAADDKLGIINFQAPDEGTGTDAILVAAGIEAVSEGDFSSSSNATKLSFKTASSEAATEKMSLSSAGLLTIADDLVIGDGKTIGSASDPDAMTITSGGDVNFSQDITIKDGGNIGSASNADCISIDSSGNVNMDHALEIAWGQYSPALRIGDASYVMFVTSGKLVISNNSAGVELANGGTSWGSYSDERAKDIIENIENALTKVNSLRAVIGKYKVKETHAEDVLYSEQEWKPTGKNTGDVKYAKGSAKVGDDVGVRRSFLIAQDVQAVLPEAVDASDSDNLTLRYTDVIPLLVASIKELKAKVETLESEITTLKGG